MSPPPFRKLKSRRPRLGPRDVAVHYAEVSAPEAFAHPNGALCPGLLDVEPPWGFPPDLFDPAETLDQVVLGLTLAANDLHSTMWALEVLERGRGQTERVNGYDGSRMGIALWATRMVVGVLHEALTAIEQNHGLLASHPDVLAATGELKAPGRQSWARVLALAVAPRTAPDRAFLLQARNNLSFHYYQPKKLADGYAKFFLQPEGAQDDPEFRRYAYASFGTRLKHHRFYFADAAVQAAAKAMGDKILGSSNGQLQRIVDDIGLGIVVFVRGFVQARILKLQHGGRARQKQ